MSAFLVAKRGPSMGLMLALAIDCIQTFLFLGRWQQSLTTPLIGMAGMMMEVAFMT